MSPNALLSSSSIATSKRRAYLLWIPVASVLLFAPVALYTSHWAPSLLIGVEAYMVASLGFIAVVSWVVISVVEPDLEAYLVSWFIAAFVFYLLVIAVLRPEWYLLGGRHDFPLGEYVFLVGFAAIGGFLLDMGASRLVVEFPRALGPIAANKSAILLLALVIPVALVGVSVATPPATTVEDVEASWGTHWSFTDPDVIETSTRYDLPALEVTLGLDAGPQRVVVETPSGATYDVLVPPDGAVSDSDEQIAVARVMDPRNPSPEVGTYTVTVESMWGQTLDETTVRLEQPPTLDYAAVDVHEKEGTVVELEVDYAGDFPTDIRSYYSGEYRLRGTDGRLDVDPPYPARLADGDAVRAEATVVDADGEPTSLEPGTYTVDVVYDHHYGLELTSTFEFDVPP